MALAIGIAGTFGAHHYPGWWLDQSEVEWDSASERVVPIAQWLEQVRPATYATLAVVAALGLGLFSQLLRALARTGLGRAARLVPTDVLLAVAVTGTLLGGMLAALALCFFLYWSPDAWRTWVAVVLAGGAVFSLLACLTHSRTLLWLNLTCLFVATSAFAVLALTPNTGSWG